MFQRKVRSHRLSGRVYQLTVDDAVRSGKITKLEDTEGALADRLAETFHTILINTDDFSRFNSPDKFGADVVEGTAFRRHHESAVK